MDLKLTLLATGVVITDSGFTISRKKDEWGVYHRPVKEIELDKNKYHEYFHVSAEQLEHVLSCWGQESQSRQWSESLLEASKD